MLLLTLDASFRSPFELHNRSLENTYICFLMWRPQRRTMRVKGGMSLRNDIIMRM